MKKTGKILCLLLSAVMLLQLAAVSALAISAPTVSWSTEKQGEGYFTPISGITKYVKMLYKDNSLIDDGTHTITDNLSNKEKIQVDWKEQIFKHSSGSYTFAVGAYENNDTNGEPVMSEKSSAFVYTKPQVSLAKATGLSFSEDTGIASWNAVDNAYSYEIVLCFSFDGGNDYSGFQHVEISGDTTTYDLAENGDLDDFNLWLEEEMEYEGADSADVLKAIYIVAYPEDINEYNPSESDYLLFTGETVQGPDDETETDNYIASGSCGDNASWTLSEDWVLTVTGTGAITNASYSDYSYDIMKVVIGEGITEIADGMFYEYAFEEISLPESLTSIGEGFAKGSQIKTVTIPAGVKNFNANWTFTKCEMLESVYFMGNPEITLTANERVNPSVKIYGYKGTNAENYAEDCGCEFVSIDPDFTINDGAEVTNSAEVTLKFNEYATKNFTQYKILDGDFCDITGDTVKYALDSADGLHDIEITFKNDNMEIIVLKSIIYNNKHNLTYKVNGETFESFVVGTGSNEIPVPENIPSIEDSTFIGWEEIPEVMPDNDVTINALFTKIDTETLNTILTPEEIESGVTASATVTPVADNANITTALINEYSKYTAAVMIDISISKIPLAGDPTAVTETDSLIAFSVDIPAELLEKREYIVLREHDGSIDVLTTKANTDGEYIEVKDGVITIYAKKFSVYALATKEVESSTSSTRKRSGSSGGAAYVNVMFAVNGGSTIDTVKVTAGKTVAEPKAPTKEGFSFDGWFTDKELTNAFDFAVPVTKATTLYAKWTELTEEDSLKLHQIVLTIDEVKATVFGEETENDVAPIIAGERTMLPARFVAEALGATVEWNAENRTVTITKDEIVIIITIDAETAMVNGEEVALDSPAFIQNDRTYTPVRFVAENLGATVSWDAENRTVTITK